VATPNVNVHTEGAKIAALYKSISIIWKKKIKGPRITRIVNTAAPKETKLQKGQES